MVEWKAMHENRFKAHGGDNRIIKNQKYGGDNIKHAKVFIFIKILQRKQKQYEEFKTLQPT